MTLQEVADRTNLSKSFISQVESGAANPSIASLKRIADTLGVPLGELFQDESGDAEANRNGASEPEGVDAGELQVVRRDRRKQVAWPGQAWTSQLLTPDLRRKLEVTLSVAEPGNTSGEEPYMHVGEELGYVLEGTLEVTAGDRTVVLEEGDSVYFASHLPHRVRVLGDRTARWIWVITPPSF